MPRNNGSTPRAPRKAAMQTRAKWLALLTLIALCGCSTPRRSVAELDTSRQEPKQAPAPQYTYTWRPRQLPREPACYDAAMCYDEKREVCVLFGGREHYFKQHGDYFEWDGQNWFKPDNWYLPGARCMHSMAYDSARGEVVLFGGWEDSDRGKNDTWTCHSWSGWHRKEPAVNPPKRWAASMAFDRKRGVTVLFGGEAWEPQTLADTWEWDGEEWTQRVCDAAPPAGRGSMIYDARRERCLFYSTQHAVNSSGVPCNSLWKWDGEKWAEVETKTRPPFSTEFVMAYDESRGVTVLFLSAEEGQPASQTWEFDGAEWKWIAEANTPRARHGASMAYNAKRKQLVLHGGSIVYAHLDETWIYDGAKWSEQDPIARPIPHGWSTMCYDTRHRVTIMLAEHWEVPFTDHSPIRGPQIEHWEWNGTDWTRRLMEREKKPDVRSGQLAFDQLRGVAVLLGGNAFSPENYPACLWEWDGDVWREISADLAHVPKGGVLWYWNVQRQCLSLLFGTFTGTPSSHGSLWHWDGKKWSEERFFNSITDSGRGWTYAYDSLRGVVVAHCPYVDRGKSEDWETPGVSSTWELHGLEWRRIASSIKGPRQECQTFCFCEAIGRVVCFGGGVTVSADPPVAYNSTFEWDGRDWRQVLPSIVPPARAGTSMAYDSDRQVIVMFGGSGAWAANFDTWEYGPDRP